MEVCGCLRKRCAALALGRGGSRRGFDIARVGSIEADPEQDETDIEVVGFGLRPAQP